MSNTGLWILQSRKRQAVVVIGVILLCFSIGVALSGLYTTTSSPDVNAPPPTDPPNVTPTPPNTSPPSSPEPNGTETRSEPSLNASLTLRGEQAVTVSSWDGDVETLQGRLNGTLIWNTAAVDSTVIIVQTWVPEHGWTQTHHVHADQASPAILGDVLDSPIRYANNSRSDIFDTPTDGTTRRHDGQIAVTAVFFDDGTEQKRISEEWNYTVKVTNRDSSGDGTSGGTDDVEINLDLGESNGTDNESNTGSSDSGAALVNKSQATPGSQYASNADLRNTGSNTGSVYLNVSYTSFENGIVNEAEAAVDSTGGDPGPGNGELHTEFELRVALVNDDGSLSYILGNESTYQKLENVSSDPVRLMNLEPEEAGDLHVEYRIDPAAGNELQSDGISLDFEFLIQE